MSRLTDRIANGPSTSEQWGRDAQIWERAWTLEELRQSSGNWSLAGDSGLLLFLQDFSQRMLSKTHDIEKQLDSLIRDTKATDSCLHSVFNDFLMLSNTQFIENRVYDEEVEETIPKVDVLEKQIEQEKTREQKEVELIPKMQEAVSYGLSVLESAFEHLDIKAGNSDSEDEEVTGRVEDILEPKDLYVDRPLPYLIGSKAFMEQDDVGLGDLSSDEMSVDSERDSVIESEDGKDASHSEEDFNQEEDEGFTNVTKKSSMLSYEEEEEDEDSDIFGESDGDGDDTNSIGPPSFADELAARITGEPVNKPEGDRASLASKKKTKGRKESKPVKPQAAEEDNDDIFKPPKMDDDDLSPFGGKGGLFSGGRGLFDDDDEGDLFSEAPKPFMSEETKALNESPKGKAQTAAAQEKPKPKKATNLFDKDGEDGDLFRDEINASARSKKEIVEEQVKHPEKKMPAGSISLFGPGTQSLLSEGLKKRPPSTSEESEKSEENGPAPAAGVAAIQQTQKPQTRGLFSDDEDTPGFPATPRSQTKPEATSRGKTSRAPLSLFDDEEEEDLFVSAAKSKSKPNQAKASTPQLSKTVSSSLFSDDEDQWMSYTSSAGKSEVKPGGMKPSASAPSGLPGAKTSLKSLFDEDEDDLFAPIGSSQKKPQRVALLFEDEDDEEKGAVFAIKPAVNANSATPPAERPAAADPQSSSLKEKSEEVVVSGTAAEDTPSVQHKPAAKTPEPLPSSPSPESSEGKKKPAGAVSLFGGINVLAGKQAKSLLEETGNDEGFLSEDSSPSVVKKEDKVQTNTLSLFDHEAGDETDRNEPIFAPRKPTAKSTLKPAEEQPQAKSTRVFQDEELLFSQTQQKDNDPDVDLFSTSGDADRSKLSSVKPAAQSLFDDDDDDLFGPVKPNAPPPKVAEKPNKPKYRTPVTSPESVSEIQKPSPSPVKPKDSSSRIGKLQANLMINPAVLLPGAVPSLPGALSVYPGTAPSSSSGVSSLSPSPATTPLGGQTEGGVSFDNPVQVTTLESTHKSRAKVSAQRRPQSRAARQQAAQRSLVDEGETLSRDYAGHDPSASGLVLTLPDKPSQAHGSMTSLNSAAPTASPASSSDIAPRPSVLALPESSNPGKRDLSKDSSSTIVRPPSDEDDLFGSNGLFGATSVTNTPSPRQTNTKHAKQPQATSAVGVTVDKSLPPSIFDDNNDDLFQKVKPRPASKKSKALSFLEEDDDEDIFGVSNSSTPTPTSTNSKEIKNNSSSKQDIFQDEVDTVPEVDKKHKEKTIDARLFDDNLDIFADLTDTFKPKQKSKIKGQTKSIFDDDMDDIFSSSTTKRVRKAPHISTKTPLSQETTTATDTSNVFNDPLNALGGN